MSLSDIFSIPFLICLSICILLIGCSSIYFYQKISQQDHKISSMVSLISSLAEETQQNKNTYVGGLVPPPVTYSPIQNTIVPQRTNGLIHVSDDEEDDDSESSESQVESDSDSESSDDSDSEDEDNHSESSEYENNDIKNIIVVSSEDLAKDVDIQSSDQLNEIDMSYTKVNTEDDHDEHDDEDNNSLFEVDDILFEEDKEDITTITTTDDVKENIKSIHIDQPSTDEITDFAIFKTINISSLDESNTNNVNNASKTFETADYKKMSITKLREIISKQGVSDASKLKKNDILKILGVE